MREIIFDTETTGLDPREDRIIEIGGVELFNRFPTGRTFHAYVNPQGRRVHPDAYGVHGISDADLLNERDFSQVGPEFLAFVGDAVLIAHNATFDMGFVNSEFTRLSLPEFDPMRVIDTLAIARRKHPMGPNSLDALCRRYGISNAHRTKHGALLDSELLAEVYIELAGGKQAALVLDAHQTVGGRVEVARVETVVIIRQRPNPLPPRITAAELAAHAALVGELGDSSLWARIDAMSGNRESATL